jgi:hypothetical protein
MLIWSSIGAEIHSVATQRQSSLQLVICPFIQLGALKRLLNQFESVAELQVVTRWNPMDLVTGVSDIEIFPYLNELRIHLYAHKSIHLKLFAFVDGTAIVGSGNLTNAGMGWSETSNVEAGTVVTLTQTDWAHVNRILRQCDRVDEAAFDLANAYKQAHAIPARMLPSFELPSSKLKGYSLLDLPAAPSPEALVQSLRAAVRHNEFAPDVAHDMQLFELRSDMVEGEVEAQLLRVYRLLPAVQALVSWLYETNSRSFGEVTAWLHSRLIDRPMPYRSDVKVAVGNIFRWLPLAFNTIKVGRPHHSEVLFAYPPASSPSDA